MIPMISTIFHTFDLIIFERIEDVLLQRKIDAYWVRKQKEEDNRKRVRDTMRQYEQQYQIHMSVICKHYETNM